MMIGQAHLSITAGCDQRCLALVHQQNQRLADSVRQTLFIFVANGRVLRSQTMNFSYIKARRNLPLGPRYGSPAAEVNYRFTVHLPQIHNSRRWAKVTR